MRKGPQTKALAQAKQVALALKLYADDHNGIYPAGASENGEKILSANDAFRCLMPTYTQSEAIFSNKLSAYQTSIPDGVILPKQECLKPGENVYGYVMGLTDSMAPGEPLVVDGTNGDGEGHYVTDVHARGGVWAGMKAVVIRLDNSGALENLEGSGYMRYVGVVGRDSTNLLSRKALGHDLRLLDPAVKQANSAR